MPINIGEEVRVEIRVGDEPIIFVFPPYEEMQSAIKKLISSRIRGRGIKQRLDIVGPRVQFVDTTLRNIENIVYKDEKGEAKLDNTVSDWLRRIPVSWKSSVASFFEESEALSEDEVGN